MRGRALAGLVGVGLIAVALVAIVVLAGEDEPAVTMDPGDDAATPPVPTEGSATPPPATESGATPPSATKDDAATSGPTDAELAETRLAEGAAVIWPFDGMEVAVIASGDAGRRELRAVADEVAGHERVTGTEVLDAAGVSRRLGPVQAQRLSPGGAVVATLDPELGEHQALVVAGRVSRSLTQRGLDEHVTAFARPSCAALANSAALTGTARAAEVLRTAGCAQHTVVAAAPDADEPWVVTSEFSATLARAQQCVEITTLRMRLRAGCASQPSAMEDSHYEPIDGVVGTPWDGDRAVVAGMAPPGTETVRLDGTPVTVAQGPPGLVDDADAGLSVFAGEIAVDGDAVTVTALGGDGAVLAERTVTPADFPGVSSVTPWRLDAAWPFERIDRAVVVVASDAAPQRVADRLAAADGIRRISRAAPQAAAAAAAVMSKLTPVREQGPRPMLVVTATDRQRALMLGMRDQRHGIAHVVTPTCGALAGSALFRGVDHARGLLRVAGCDAPTVVAAPPEAEPPWAMAAARTDEGLCAVLQSSRSTSVPAMPCGPPAGEGGMRLHVTDVRTEPLMEQLTEPSPRGRAETASPEQAARQLIGVVGGEVATVELRVADGVVAEVDPVAVTDSASAFAARVDPGSRSLHVRAVDAEGGVVAEEVVAEGG